MFLVGNVLLLLDERALGPWFEPVTGVDLLAPNRFLLIRDGFESEIDKVSLRRTV